jgi:hypothetical protein
MKVLGCATRELSEQDVILLIKRSWRQAPCTLNRAFLGRLIKHNLPRITSGSNELGGIRVLTLEFKWSRGRESYLDPEGKIHCSFMQVQVRKGKGRASYRVPIARRLPSRHDAYRFCSALEILPIPPFFAFESVLIRLEY